MIKYKLRCAMDARRKKQQIRSKKATARKIMSGARRGSKKSKISILEQSGLLGCLTGTGVTSDNYKDFLHSNT